MGNILSNNKQEISENHQLVLIEMIKTKLDYLEMTNKKLTEQFILERNNHKRQVISYEAKLKRLEDKLGKLEANQTMTINEEVINKVVEQFLDDDNINCGFITDYLERSLYRNILNLTVKLLDQNKLNS